MLQHKGDASIDPGVSDGENATKPDELASGSKKLADKMHDNNANSNVYFTENFAAPAALFGQTSAKMTKQNHKNFAGAAQNPGIGGVAPVGDAF